MSRVITIAPLTLACFVACSSNNSSGGGTTSRPFIVVNAGDGQTAPVGTDVAVAPSVLVRDSLAKPLAGDTVVFGITGGGGVVRGGTAVSDANGVATVTGWTLGTVPGANTLGATLPGAGGSPVTFHAISLVGPVAALRIVAGDSQTGPVGQPLPVVPSVKVQDNFGNVIGGATVNFAALGGGSVLDTTATSSGNGVASAGIWTLGSVVGIDTLTASSGAARAIFTATASTALDVSQFVGTYTGAWNNTTFSSTGTGTVVIAITPKSSTATATITVTGPVLGTAGIAQQIETTTYGATSAAFSGTITTMGDVTASIDANGNITASGIHVPGGTITRWDAQGTITHTQLQLTFTVTFVSGPPAIGTITLNRAA